jgi:hypothetical protein
MKTTEVRGFMKVLIVSAALALGLASSPLAEKPRIIEVRGLRVRLGDNPLPDQRVFLVSFDGVLGNNTSDVLRVSPYVVHQGSTEQQLSSGEWSWLAMAPFEISQSQSVIPGCLSLLPGERMVIPGLGDSLVLPRDRKARSLVVRFHFSLECRHEGEKESTPLVTVPVTVALPRDQ